MRGRPGTTRKFHTLPDHRRGSDGGAGICLRRRNGHHSRPDDCCVLWKNPFFKFDLIINSKDLTNSLAIIADAAINDIIKGGERHANFNKPVPKNPENEKFSNSQRNRVNQASGDYDKIQGQISSSKTTGAYLDQIIRTTPFSCLIDSQKCFR